MLEVAQRGNRILSRLGATSASDLIAAVREASVSVDARNGWRNYAKVVANSMERGSWRDRVRNPRAVVTEHAEALANLLEPHGVLLAIQPEAQVIDVLVTFGTTLPASDQNDLIGWLTAELSVSTVTTHRVRAAIGVRYDSDGLRLRVIPPPSFPIWLALLGSFGDAVAGEFLRRHELLLTTEEEIASVGASADEAERHLGGMLDALDAGYLSTDRSGTHFFASERLCELTDIEAESVSDFASAWLKRTPIEHLEETNHAFSQLRACIAGVYSVALMQGRKTRMFELAVYDSEHGVSAMFSDFTDRYRADQRAQTRQTTLHSLLQAAPFAIAVHRENEVLFANSHYERDLATTLSSITDETVQISRNSNSILPIRELEVRATNGSVRAFEQNTSMVEWGNGGAFLTVFRETTNERAFLAKSFELDRVVALGTLADGVAHEINNPLAYVQSNLEFAVGLAKHTSEEFGGEISDALMDALDGSKRVSQLVADFRHATPGDDAQEVEAVDLRDVLETAQNVANATVRTRANVSVEIDVPGRVRATNARLAQVFINLLVNAAQAIPDGRRGQIRVVAEHLEPEWVRIEVRDNGTGIPADQLDSVFAPFFTTKPPGEGTGLGLSICRNIVEQYGGRLSIESDYGRGTTVCVELRLAENYETLPVSVVTNVSEGIEDGVRVLVIDDDPHILRMVERVLSNTCNVTTADNPREGLELAIAQSFDLIISDVIMPQLTGPKLFELLLQQRPEYRNKVVLMSGGRRVVGNSFGLETLQKPFGVRDLKRLVRDALQADGEAA